MKVYITRSKETNKEKGNKIKSVAIIIMIDHSDLNRRWIFGGNPYV